MASVTHMECGWSNAEGHMGRGKNWLCARDLATYVDIHISQVQAEQQVYD